MDEILNWHWWMYAAVLFLIIEVFTPGFIVACLGLGSLVAAITAYMGYNIDAQFIAFSASTLISLFLIRPLLYKKGEKQDKIKTNTCPSIPSKARKYTRWNLIQNKLFKTLRW